MFVLWFKEYFSGPNEIFEKDNMPSFIKNGKIEGNKWTGSKAVESFSEDGKVIETVIFTFGFEIVGRPYFPPSDEQMKKWEEVGSHE